MAVENNKIYQIIAYTVDGIEIYLETTDKEHALEKLEDCDGVEAHLVEVLRTNQREGFYYKNGKRGPEYIHLNG